jgi:hypothetical protein
LVRRSANVVGVVSVRLSNTFTSPAFSATKTRPSGENRTAVGALSPLKTVDSEKPGRSRPVSNVASAPQRVPSLSLAHRRKW